MKLIQSILFPTLIIAFLLQIPGVSCADEGIAASKPKSKIISSTSSSTSTTTTTNGSTKQSTASQTTSAASKTTTKKKKPAIQLDSRNFDSSLSDGNVWLIEFYASWCGHCKRFEADYETVANILHDMHDLPPSGNDKENEINKRKVMVAKVDGAAERALSSRFSIRGYPEFFLVEGWTVTQYDGPRTVQKVVDFALTSHKDIEPVPFLNSPFGPMGQVRSILMKVGSRVMVKYDHLVEERGFSKAIASMILGSVGVTVGIVMLITIGLLVEIKPKQE